ncbi:MAG TPA: hypothetical protein VFS55_17060 [Dokdonella sp.]|nr:hypothetical protein [Dokdonella sp.]
MAYVATRSTFVTVVAWIFIVLSGFGTFVCALQNIIVALLSSKPEFAEAMHAPVPAGTPPFAAFVFGHLHLFLLAMLLVTALTLASAIGLLLRRNWARLTFVGLMALGMIWSIASVVLQWFMLAPMREQFGASHRAPDMSAFVVAISALSAAFAIGFACFYGWIAKRLLSREIAMEFAGAVSARAETQRAIAPSA